MRQLLGKYTPFRWTSDCDLELTYLEDCLVKDQILRPLDPNRDRRTSECLRVIRLDDAFECGGLSKLVHHDKVNSTNGSGIVQHVMRRWSALMV